LFKYSREKDRDEKLKGERKRQAYLKEQVERGVKLINQVGSHLESIMVQLEPYGI